jgi:hypothetical protein
MPYFLLTFGDASRPPVGGCYHRSAVDVPGRMTAVVRRLAPDVPFGEGLKLSGGNGLPLALKRYPAGMASAPIEPNAAYARST